MVVFPKARFMVLFQFLTCYHVGMSSSAAICSQLYIVVFPKPISLTYKIMADNVLHVNTHNIAYSLISRVIEAVCIGWFTAECIIRFIVSRDKCEFVRRPLNIIDLLAITPYYVSVTVTVLTGENSQLQRAGVTLRVLRILRIFWVIKLARHFLGLQTLGLTLRRCYREMVMLLVFICVAMAIFSALAQLLEGGNQDYTSIPAASWWVIISMTTVGYGDMYPVTVAGRVLGGFCVVSGIVLLALPITFIYHSFVQCYHELKVRSIRCIHSLSADIID